jgi:hypothetical protein
MLPGVRFVFAATVLAVAVVIFGLGAAAFLRAAHENLASATIWRPIDEPLAGQIEPVPPTLALLRVEPEPSVSSAAPSDATSADVTSEAMPVATPLPEAAPAVPPQTNAAPASAEPEKPATPVQAEAEPPVSPAETMAAETAAPSTDVPPSAAVAASEPAATSEAVIAGLASEPKPEMLQAPPRPDLPAPAAAQTPPAVETPAVALAAQDGVETMPGAATAPGTDTLKPEERQIRTAMVSEPALPEVAPLPAREVRLPAPRIDPSVLEARRKQLVLQQQARKARAAKARRIAAIRARTAAQAHAAAAAAADPFGNPSNTIPTTRR